MFDRIRAVIGLVLVLSVNILCVAGCQKSGPAPDPKAEVKKPTESPPKKTETAKPPVSAAPADTLVPLLETLPKKFWPRDDKDTARFEEAGKWLKANLSGKRASVTSSLSDINITPPSKQGEKYRLSLKNGPNKGGQFFYVVRGKGDLDKIESGLDFWGRHSSVELRKPDDVDENLKTGLNLTVDKPEVDRLRTLETRPGGRDVKLTFTIDDVRVGAGLLSISVKDLVVENAES